MHAPNTHNDEELQAELDSLKNDVGRYKTLVKSSFIVMSIDIFELAFEYLLFLYTGSLVILADALHSLGDFLVSLSVFFSITINRHFDNRVAKHAEGLVSLLIAAFILYGSWRLFFAGIDSFLNPVANDMSQEKTVVAIVGVTVACIMTFLSSRFKRKVGEKNNSIAFESEAAHSFSDFLTTLGVLFTIVLRYFGVNLDWIMTILISVIIFAIGFHLVLKGFSYFQKYSSTYKRVSLFVSKCAKLFLPFDTHNAHHGIESSIRSLLSGIRWVLLEKIIIGLFCQIWPLSYIYKKLILLQKDIHKSLHEGIHLDEYLFIHKWKVVQVVVILELLLYLGTGFYTVSSNQTGITLNLGKATAVTTAGFHYHLPPPFGDCIVINTQSGKRVESGFRTDWTWNKKEPEAYLWEYSHTNSPYSKNFDESVTLTGDENLIDANVVAYFIITDTVQYALSVKDPDEMLRSLLTSRVHKTLGHYPLDTILTIGRGFIEQEIKTDINKALSQLPLGVTVDKVHMQEMHPPVDVIPKYRGVASAREKKSRIIHRASAYANNTIPRARGKAEAEKLKAQGFALEKVTIAEGDAEYFLKRNSAFSKNKATNKSRMRWNAIHNNLKGKPIHVVPSESKRRVYTFENPKR